MPKRALENNDWARLGDLVIRYWRGELTEAYILANIGVLLEEHGWARDESTSFEPHFDEESKLHVVFPTNPWTKEELDAVSQLEAYRRELGIIILGGCK